MAMDISDLRLQKLFAYIYVHRSQLLLNMIIICFVVYSISLSVDLYTLISPLKFPPNEVCPIFDLSNLTTPITPETYH